MTKKRLSKKQKRNVWVGIGIVFVIFIILLFLQALGIFDFTKLTMAPFSSGGFSGGGFG